jgi:hypothetical protein
MSAQSAGVSHWPRTPTVEGVRWKTTSSFAHLATSGTIWIAVAPVPMIPTRLSRSFVRFGCEASPPV